MLLDIARKKFLANFTSQQIDTIRGSRGANFLDKAKRSMGSRRVGVSGDAGEDFKNVNLKINEHLQFLIILMKILFQNLLKHFSNFYRKNLGQNL